MSERFTRSDGATCSPFLTGFPCRDAKCPDRDTTCPKMAKAAAKAPVSDDTRDLIAEALERIEARLLGGSIFLSHSQADDLATLRAALEQRKPTLPDSELLGEIKAGLLFGLAPSDSTWTRKFAPDGNFWLRITRTDANRIIAALEQADRRARGVEDERDELATMLAELADETTGAGATPQDCIHEARRRLALRDQRHTGGEG